MQEYYARQIVEAVERHVDDVLQAYIQQVTEDVCEFCGEEWEDAPVCCEAAIAEQFPLTESSV